MANYFRLEPYGSRYYIGNDSMNNATDLDAGSVLLGGGTLWDFQFGAVGTTHVLVWDAYNEGLEGALETAAEWLAENAPGYLTPDEELRELIEEAEAEGLDEEAAYEQATADLTYTESGYLTSYEWWVNEIHVPKDAKGLTGNNKKVFWRAVALSMLESEEEDLDEGDFEEIQELILTRGPDLGELKASLGSD